MNKNVLGFIKYLENNDFPMENVIKKEEKESSHIQFMQEIGENAVAAIISFPDKNNCVDIYIVGIANTNNIKDLSKMYKVLNEINEGYRYGKFYIDNQGLVNISYSLPLEIVDNGTILNLTGLFIQMARDESSKILNALNEK